MDWEQTRSQLESILGTPLVPVTLEAQEWERLTAAERGESAEQGPVQSVVHDRLIWFLAQKSGSQVTALQVNEALLTTSERKLVELTLEARRSNPDRRQGSSVSMTDEEKRALALRDWLLQQSEQGRTEAELPDGVVAQLSLYTTRIPLLLYGDYAATRKVPYQELRRLLESFFGTDILLIPLMEKEWMILGPESLLANSGDDRDDGGEETVEETLSALVSGLHAMLESEWIGECHLAVDLPMQPGQHLLRALHRLRETMMLGRLFHVSSNIHLPWMLQLEKLLHLLPERDRVRYLEQVLKGAEHVLDTETQTTLEQFFALDCNVSETAKKLYVHRNTLLYRLDKFKNETGLDVRSFGDAVLVRIALLLYKVTKRK